MTRFLPFLAAVMLVTAECGAISLDDFIESLMTNHPAFKSERLSVKIEAKALESLSFDEDWILRSSPSFSYREPLDTGPFTPDDVETASINIGTERSIWRTGGRLSAEWRYNLIRQSETTISIPGQEGFTEIPGAPATQHQNGLYLQYSHPLMGNKNGIQDRLAYDLQMHQLELSRKASAEILEDFLAHSIERYIEWVKLHQHLKIVQSRRDLAKKSVNHQTKEQAANLIEKVDLLRAQDSLESAEQNVARTESHLNAVIAELSQLTGDQRFKNNPPTMDLLTFPKVPDLKKSFDFLANQSRQALIMENTLNIVQRQLQSIDNQADPDISLNLSGGLRAGEEAFDESLDISQPDVSVTVVYRHPLGGRKPQAELDKVRLEEARIKEKNKEAVINLKQTAAGIHERLQGRLKLHGMYKKQINTAKARTEEESRLYSQGRNNLTFVIQSRDHERNVQFWYMDNAAAIHSLIIQYRALLDQILPNPLEE